MLSFTSTSETDTSGYTNKKNFKFYVNGELRNSYTRTGNRYNLNTNENLMIGSSSDVNNNNFKGSMDEVRIYNKALSDEEIGSLYNNSSVQKVNATISIPKGSTSGTIEVKGTDDQTTENNETILSKIVSTTGASETGDQSATIVLTDDDNTTISLSVSSNSINEGTNQFATLTATLDKVSELPVDVFLKSSGVDDSDFRISTSSDTSSTAAELMAHYTFSGNANDETSNANNGTVSGATITSDRFGESNSAYEFAGGPDYVKIPWDKSLEIKNTISMSLWIKLPQNEEVWQQRTVINGLDGVYLFNVQRRNNGWAFGARAQLINQEIWTDDLGQIGTEWNHVVFTQEPDGENNSKNKIYLNGALIKEETFGRGDRSYNGENSLLIGTFRESETHNAFRGSLDDLRIYKGTLTKDDVVDLYEQEKAGKVDLKNFIINAGKLTHTLYVIDEDDNVMGEGNETLNLSID